MTIDVAQLMVRVNADTAMAQQGLMGLSGLLGSGGVLGLGLAATGAAVAGIGVASTKMAGDFQQSLTQIVTGAGESQSNLKLISDGILQLANNTGTSTKQLTDGLYMIESAGYHGQAGLDVLKAAAEGAKVGNADLGTVADATTTILKDFGDTGINANQAVNTLVTTVANGKTHMQDLAGAMSQILPTAKATGVGLQDAMGAMATMTGEGVDAANAATYLRQMMLALSAPSSTAKKALADVGLSADDLNTSIKNKGLPATLQMITDAVGKKFPEGSTGYINALKDISGGSRQMQGMLDLTGTHLTEFKNNAQTVAGALDKGKNSVTGWSLVQGDFNQKLDVAKEHVETMMISLGQKLLPVAGQLVDFFTSKVLPLFDNLGGLFGKNNDGLGKQLLPTLQQFAGFVTSTVVPTVMQLAKWFEEHVVPIVAKLAVIFVQDVLPTIEQVAGSVMKNLLPPLERLWNILAPALVPEFQLLGSILKNVVGPVLGDVIGIVGWLIDRLDDLLSALKPVMDLIGKLESGAAGALNGVGGFLSHLPHFADGGVMQEGGLALVGERGPELVQLPAGAQVIPNPQVASVASLGIAGPGGAAASAGSMPSQQTIVLQVDGRKMAAVVLQHAPTVLRNATGTRTF